MRKFVASSVATAMRLLKYVRTTRLVWKCNLTARDLQTLQELSGETLLVVHRQKWHNYLFSRKVLSHVCQYINRHSVTRARDDSRPDVYEIHAVRLFAFCFYQV